MLFFAFDDHKPERVSWKAIGIHSKKSWIDPPVMSSQRQSRAAILDFWLLRAFI